MGIEDRDWYREDRKRRQSEAGFHSITTMLRRWRRRGVRHGVGELLRWGLVAVGVYATWSMFRD